MRTTFVWEGKTRLTDGRRAPGVSDPRRVRVVLSLTTVMCPVVFVVYLLSICLIF